MSASLRSTRIALRTFARLAHVASFAGTAFVTGLFLTSSVPPARAAEADRIVALGGAVTEILYALGQQDRIAAVDATSLFPPDALKEKPNVGYFRSVSAEGILSVRPSRVIAIEGAGPPNAIEAIAQAGIPVTRVPDSPTPEGVSAKIEAIGEAAGASAQAQRLAADVGSRISELARLRSRIGTRKRVLFVLALQNGRLLTGGRGTAADAIITLAGGVNSGEAFEGYKPMADEAIIGAAPDAIVMMNRGTGAVAEDVLALPAVAATPAGKARAVFVMDGLYLIGFGPRTPDAARDLMEALYPALDLPRLSATANSSPNGVGGR